ncbi:hypothetical protein OIU76_018259 [Salix suchowensis]|nr:hypothetical protein OIU76_018259 [Salix suchowensis]
MILWSMGIVLYEGMMVLDEKEDMGLDGAAWAKIPVAAFLSHSGLSDVPANWKGIRETRPDFPASSCNKKLIGARAFNNGYITHKVRPNEESKESASPRDTEGHGTHTATSAAGL